MSSKFAILTAKAKNKKIIFGDDGEVASQIENKTDVPKTAISNGTKRKFNVDGPKKEKHKKDNNLPEFRNRKKPQVNDEMGKKWFQVLSDYNTNFSDLVELKEHELKELQTLCRKSFDAELPNFTKKNPSDGKWLETALHKGTSKDRANAGALLVQSNPLGNLSALETLIGLCKVSNKTASDVVIVLSELFQDALLPADRKLIPLTLRGADWKAMKKRDDLSNETKSLCFSYWHFENELKDQYFVFLQNLQGCIHAGQDSHKSTCIVQASRLLMYAPEKEQMLLSMLVNKLGDPSSKVASKALHHLSEVAFKHPNMCGVITLETEKLLFRNNISESAQHFALCFLGQIAPKGHPDVCTKLVNICFALFKVLVQKGAVNNKTMQAILRCLQKAIVDAKPPAGSNEIMTKDMQDTVYRLVHLADIQISIQTFSLLLQLVAVKTQKSDRFYNALYKKMLDLNLTTIGAKTASQFLHIIHRAIHFDGNVQRSLALIKRLLQITLHMPAQIGCGCLIVVSKLLATKKELQKFGLTMPSGDDNPPAEINLSKFDSDEEEIYNDVESDGDEGIDDTKSKQTNAVGWSWQSSVKQENPDMEKTVDNIKDMAISKYDPYHRVPSFAGADLTIWAELTLLQKHFHPTLAVFAENIINRKKIDYYGDPLRDFALSQFLERFAFKNPKKAEGKPEEGEKPKTIVQHKKYTPNGVRGQSVKLLTKDNCTEDERFIFNYLEKKREKDLARAKSENDNDEVFEDVDDDEFDEYLDSLCKKSNDVDNDDDSDGEELDYLKELGTDLQDDDVINKKKKGKKASAEESESEMDDDWDDDNVVGDSDDEENEELGSDDAMSISEGEDDDLSEADSDEDDEPKNKKSKKLSNEKDFSKKMKRQDDISSLFAAADDFAELLEETGKIKGHGTSSALFNKDKSSQKQLKWEEKRRSSFSNKKPFRNSGKKFNKKRK